MPPTSKQYTGKLGEDLACAFLQKQGYKIIERNFQKKHGDIDIVALDSNTLVFIEVKTRRSHTFGLPAESITPRKIQALIKSAQLYHMLHPNLPELMRIDVVAIDYTQKIPTIELIKNITF